MTGWTYAPAPGYDTEWTNVPYYFAPMVAFEIHHDTTQKNIGLPVPCVIPPGGTAEADLDAALDLHLAAAERCTVHLLPADPAPGNEQSVACLCGAGRRVFTASNGNLQSVVNAILTDSEAATAGTGKLTEPVLYATGLLRALNATVVDGSGLASQTNGWEKIPMVSPTVFNYFSPFYTLPGTRETGLAPEFQSLNAATAIARANFAYRAVTNGIASTVMVNLNNWLDLATLDPSLLGEAASQAFPWLRWIPICAAYCSARRKARRPQLSRVRSVLLPRRPRRNIRSSNSRGKEESVMTFHQLKIPPRFSSRWVAARFPPSARRQPSDRPD